MPVIAISSDDLIQIEQHFKVSAGPGAGKTHWLVNHIAHILRESKRLGSYRKIACITYTNIAVETISKRLNSTADRVEVSTIHGFIYHNILKPYLSFIAHEYGFDIRKMDGHDDHFVSRAKLKEWIDAHPNLSKLKHPFTRNQLLRLPANLDSLKSWMQSIHYTFNGSDVEIAVDNKRAFLAGASSGINKATMDKLSVDLIGYKKLYWVKGRLHHDDVLFFGYKLLIKYPFILKVLRARFPYFVIDEFQDTSPIQTAIIKLLAAEETIVGVIGDKAQSIFSFQGASPADFSSFTLPNQNNYEINDNRRSTNRIVDVLNTVRTDIRQKPSRAVPGDKPSILVGTRKNAFAHVKSQCGNEPIITLSRDNVMARSMMKEYNSAIPARNLLSDLFDKDNSKRANTVVRCMKAVDLGLQNRFKEAIRELERVVVEPNRELRRKKAFQHLSILLSQYQLFKSAPLYDFYTLIKTHIDPGLTKLANGNIKNFYENVSFDQVILFIDTNVENPESKTIHAAKGDEFNNVLVVFTKDKEINCLITPDLTQEEHRVKYVAFSRAKSRLFISVENLDKATAHKLNPLFEIINV
ncbi:ATP-dependent helicase [Algoriphagus confluentis]|uniref:DNA 3'-5' helicase n=1 Tax=Algoriphagus confluentis TaxID=1697556 RepID=A0ABQ6PJY9_9BACT|nr:ATP-dependent helicase [Algoriphagus confluentis]